MGIEPTGKALPELENKRFRAMAHAKCDWRVNFRGMRGNVGLRRDTSMCEISESSFSGVGLEPPNSGHSLLCCDSRRAAIGKALFVCTIHTMHSRELIKLLQADGWWLHPRQPPSICPSHKSGHAN